MKMIPYDKEKHGKYIEGVKPRCYVRGDIDRGGNMWTSFIPLSQIDHAEREALNAYTKKFVDMPCMASVASLYEFCLQYPEAAVGDPEDKTFLFFKKDGFSAYLIKVICREKDYNFYINAYPIKAD